MQATIKLAGGARLITVEGETQKALFEGMAMAYEVFNETVCGLCGSTNIRPVHRVADKYHFYEYHCQEPSCLARMSLGQLSDNEGSLFPVRKLLNNGKPSWKDGEYGQHNGWTKFKGEGRGEESQEEPPRGVPQSNLPPAPPLTILRNMLGDMQVPDSEPKMQDDVIRFCTRGKDGPMFGFSECAKSSEKAQKAVERLQSALDYYKSGADLLADVQKWLGAKKA